MKEQHIKTPASTWISLVLIMFGLVGAIWTTANYAPEQQFVLGLLTGIGAGVALVAAWLFYKDSSR